MITPEIPKNIEVPISNSDIRIDTYRASGAGGQHVNKTDSAIRITHIPTGVVVSCQNERSQLRNKETAMNVLRGILYKMEDEKQQKEMEKKYGEKKQITWGNQIRSYVLHPYNLVKDLRTNYQTSDIQKVLNGGLDPFIKEYLQKNIKK